MVSTESVPYECGLKAVSLSCCGAVTGDCFTNFQHLV